MPSLPNLLATMAAEMYVAAANNNANNINPPSINQTREGLIKQDNNKNVEQLKQLVNDISCRKYTFSNFISANNLTSLNEQPKPIETTPRKRKKNCNDFLAKTNKAISSEPHRIRKLKLYTIEEKIDIIDYAKIIGNRAAGREFNVAESSIREWRKNEERLR